MQIKILNKSRHSLPKYETLGSAGMDIKANIDSPIVLNSLERIAVPTGLFLEIPFSFEAQIRPRSGMALKHGLSIPNSPGTIDSDYRGEVKVILINLSNEVVTIHDGDRIAQMVIVKHEHADWIEVETIDETNRGEGGFGSTGK